MAVVNGDLKNAGLKGSFVRQNWYLPALVSVLRARRNQKRRTWGTVNEWKKQSVSYWNLSKAYLLCRMLLSIAKLTLAAGAPFASCDLLEHLSAGYMPLLCFLIGYNVCVCSYWPIGSREESLWTKLEYHPNFPVFSLVTIEQDNPSTLPFPTAFCPC